MGTVVEVPYFENWWGGNSLEDQLSYAITDTNFEVAFAVVDEEDVNNASIVGVDDTSANVDKELAC